MERYSIRVANDDLVFSAAHFITLDGGVCEPLHGHDYRLTAEIEGPLDENHYVVDYWLVYDALKGMAGQWDHAILLPLDHADIRVEAAADEVTVRFAQRRWVFPRSECRLLPVPNTTTELLARLAAHSLVETIRARTGASPIRVRLEIAEAFGMSAACEVSSGK